MCEVVSCLGTSSLSTEIFWFDWGSSQPVLVEYLLCAKLCFRAAPWHKFAGMTDNERDG